MARLQIDFDILQQTISNYQKSLDDFTQLKDKLDKVMAELKTSGWVSGASTQYFSTYDETWRKNMEIHILIIKHFEECLSHAQTEYEGLYSDIPSLGNDL